MYTPKDTTEIFSASAISKSSMLIHKFLILATLGGAFIAFGGLLSVVVAGGMPGIGASNPGLVKFVAGALFPIGLIMVMVTGADLFTSDCAAFTYPLLEKEIKISTFCKYLLLSYLFNFVGAQFVAYFLSFQAGLLDSDPWQTYLHHYADAKVNQEWMTVLLKGIAANWLVCLGVFMGYAGRNMVGKCVGIWIPVMLFVTLGFEHSIANMFFVPAAIYSGAHITWGAFVFQNLIPATVGNFLGGSILVGGVYWYLYMKK